MQLKQKQRSKVQLFLNLGLLYKCAVIQTGIIGSAILVLFGTETKESPSIRIDLRHAIA